MNIGNMPRAGALDPRRRPGETSLHHGARVTSPRKAGRFSPVTLGSPKFRALQAGGVRVTAAAFPAGAVLPMHAHEKTVFSVILSGGFQLDFDRTSHDCAAGTAFVEPGGENHGDRIGPDGARVLVIEIASESCFANELGRLLAEPRTLRDDDVGRRARRLELHLGADACSPLSIESDVLELLATAARPFVMTRALAPGGRLERVREMLHASIGTALRVGDLAREVGVHRVHLGRSFQARYGISIGDYHRRLRIQWAAEQLADPATPLALIALRAGFADHGHFTRVFRKLMGMTPSAYRERLGERMPRLGRSA